MTFSGAASADFCSDYARDGVALYDQARRVGCNVSNPNWQSHYNWCVRNPPARANAARANGQRQFAECRARQGGGYGGGGYGGGGYGGGGGGGFGGGSGPGFCQNYAQGMVAIGAEAMRKGCYGQGLNTNYNGHFNWCMRNPPGRVQAGAARNNAMLANCNR